MSKKQFLVIGPGKVGLTFAKLAASAGFTKVILAGRSENSLNNAKHFLSSEVFQFCFVNELTPAMILDSEFVCISTQDKNIPNVQTELLKLLENSTKSANDNVVFHLSGHKSSETLNQLSNLGFSVASAHPVRSITSPESASANFAGTYCAIEGDETAKHKLHEFISEIGGIPIEIETAMKPIYHAAAVVACNYSIALYDTSMQMYAKAGIPNETAQKLITSLVESTIANFAKLGLPESLTGPIERGDVDTISEHIAVLEAQMPKFAKLYRVLAIKTLEIAQEKGLDESAINALINAIES